jgi:hypothetical protein
MREASQWTKAVMRKDGRLQVIIPKDITDRALGDGKIPPGQEMEVCFTALRDHTNGRGSIHIRVRPRKPVLKNESLYILQRNVMKAGNGRRK